VEGFAKSKDVHRTLIRVFDSWFKENGFRRNRSDKCAYFRSDGPASRTFSAFEVQCSQFAQDWTGVSMMSRSGAAFSSRESSRCLIGLLLVLIIDRGLLFHDPRMQSSHCIGGGTNVARVTHSWRGQTDAGRCLDVEVGEPE